MPERPKGLPC